MNHIADSEKPYARYDVEDVVDISGHSDADTAVDLEERSVVGSPGVVGDVIADVKQTSCEHCAGASDAPRQEWDACAISLPQDECDKKGDTDDQHRNEARTSPTIAQVVMDVEGQEEHNKTSGQEESSNDFDSCQY